MPYRCRLPVLIFLLLCWSAPALWVQAGQHVPVPDREANETTRRGAVTNITVFFELLPEECFFDPAPTAEQRKDLLDGKTVNGLRIGVRDIRNGYMNLTGTIEGVWEMCFWNTADKGKLVAVNVRSCGPVCGTRLFFYRLDADGVLQPDPEVWSALERQLEPGDFYQKGRLGPRELEALKNLAKTAVYDLPRLGRDIVARRDENAPPEKGVPEMLMRSDPRVVFVWDGMSFTKKP